MQFLVLAPCPFLMMRGKPIRVLNNALALALDGHSLVLATYAVGQDLAAYLPDRFRAAAARIEVRRVQPGFPLDPNRLGLSLGKAVNDLVLYRLARRLLRERPFDAIVCHDADGMLIGLRLKRRAGIPAIYDMHGSLTELMINLHHAPQPVLRIAQRVERRLYAGADVILANWPHLPDKIDARYAAKVSLVADRPPVTTIGPGRVPNSEVLWKRENGVDRLLVYVGNFAPYQRVDLLLDMMTVLARRRVEATLCLIGPGFERLQRRLSREASADIRFLGPRHGEELARILACADVALSPRVTVNYPPMKVISYLTAAVPIVATDCAAHRVMIDDGLTGLLVEPTPDAFADAVARLLGDEVLRARLRHAAGEQGHGYTMESLATELRTALEQLPQPARKTAS